MTTPFKNDIIYIMTNYKNDILKVIPFVKSITSKTADKALNDMARALVSSLHESNTNVDLYIKGYRNDKIFNPSCLFETGSYVFDYVKKPYKEFAKVLFEMRPVGLGTPNAMVGEGEFMCIFLSPRVGIAKKKNTGDITVDGKSIELKGGQVRIMGSVSGKELQKHAKSLSCKVKPNKTNKDRTAFEPWGTSPPKEKHWQEQFDKLGMSKSTEYLNDLLSKLFDTKKINFKECFVNNKFSAKILQKIILINLFKSSKKLWDAFTILDKGNVFCITSCEKNFEKLVSEGKIKVIGDYFRSFQDTNVGMYCEYQTL